MPKKSVLLPWGSFVFLASFCYAFLWNFQGFDMTDEGAHLSNALWMVGPHVSDYEHNWISWLTYQLGGQWLHLTEDFGLFGARLGWNLVVGILSWVTYKVFCIILSPKHSCFLVILSTVILLHRGLKVIDYHNLPALILIGAIGCMIFSQKQSASKISMLGWAMSGGLLLGVGVMARFPFILTLFFPFVAPFLFRIYGNSWSFRAWKNAVISFISAGLGILLSAFYLQSRGFLQNYLDVLYRSTFTNIQRDYHHSIDFLFYVTLGSIGKSLIMGVFIISVVGVCVVISSFVFKTERMRIAFLAIGLLATFLVLRLYTATAGFHLILWGICMISAISYLLFALYNKKNAPPNQEEILIATLGMLAGAFGFLGSNGGVGWGGYALYLILPFMLWKLPYFLYDLLSLFKVRVSLKELQHYGMVLICTLAIAGFVVRFTNTYRDLPNRFLLIAPLTHERTQGIFTSPQRAKNLNQLFEKLDEVTDPKDTILVYHTAPMVHYVTQTIPALDSAWPSVLGKEELIDKMEKLLKNQQYPKIVVKTKGNMRTPEWGTINTYSGNLEIADERLIPLGYQVIWENADFQILAIEKK